MVCVCVFVCIIPALVVTDFLSSLRLFWMVFVNVYSNFQIIFTQL